MGAILRNDYQLGALTNVILDEVGSLLQQLYKSHGADRNILDLMQVNLDEALRYGE